MGFTSDKVPKINWLFNNIQIYWISLYLYLKLYDDILQISVNYKLLE